MFFFSHADKYIDLVIPRGSGDLVKYIKVGAEKWHHFNSDSI
jgi:gamma-glutamyl phosphate reductase